ncbi:hypothetical protein C8Q79DRAFT_688850 [Trametes meyenii]|nr:hypothetical protein C8Q79DRAFT_688850 [Trametes meyenii]
MASYTYLDTPNANLVCCICRSPFVEPCTTRTCYHTFCYECISQAITVNRHCPIDRTPLSLHDLAPADPVIRNLVDELVVKCPQERLGCTYNCQRLLLSVHLRDSCQYTQVNCQRQGCVRRFLKKDAEEHCCEDVASEHSSDEASVPDDAQDNCSVNEDDRPSATHTPQSSPRPSQADLAAENTFLHLRLSALENVVHVLRNEMFAVKHALGPWYRPEVQPQSYDNAQPTQMDPRPSAQRVETSPQNDIRPYAASVSESPSVTLANPSDIASYFPTPDEETSDAPSGQPRRSRATTNAQQQMPLPSSAQQPPAFTSSSTSHTATTYSNPSQGNAHNLIYASGSYSPSASLLGMSHSQSIPLATTTPATVSVPPLDPTTPLPDTLASLHSSLVTIAGALGALAAARGSEALRTAEELRGLRGAMHGLRMQARISTLQRIPLTICADKRPPVDRSTTSSPLELISLPTGRPGLAVQAWIQTALIRPQWA